MGYGCLDRPISLLGTKNKGTLMNERGINDNVTILMDESGLAEETTSKIIDEGRASLSENSQQLEETIAEKQQVYSAGSAPSIHEYHGQGKNKTHE